MTWAGVVAVLAALSGAGTAAAPDVRPPRPASDLDVPFVAQGALLCGGAAAAMVERYWGARGVYGEDFGHLVREAEGGIRASELTDAMRDRGYDVEIVSGDPARVFAALDRGVPPILLLESGATRLHYVVLVEVVGRDAWIHDPNFGPRRRISVAALSERWTASGMWALFAVPSASGRDVPAAIDPVREPSVAPSPGGVVPSPSPALTEAMERLRSGDPAGARAAVEPLVEEGGGEALLGRRVLATSWYLDGEPERALAEWNALGEPVVDLVHIDGLRATRHHAAASRIPIAHGRMLTPRALALARRRLAQLPALEASRIAYRPLPGGTVEVQASVLERPRLPGASALAAQGARALVQQRATLELGPLLAGGDRWRVSGSWAPAQRYVGGSMAAPAPPLPGIATVGMEWRRERFGRALPGADPTLREVRTEHRSRGFLSLEEWVHPRVRVGVTVGLESWRLSPWTPEPDDSGAPGRMGSLELAARWSGTDDGAWVTVEGAGWAGAGRSFGRARVEAGVDVPRGARREWRIRGGAIAASAGAPRTVWPGAGTGGIREPLLRGHDLVEDGVIGGPSLGRELLHGTVEHRLFHDLGLAQVGASVFVDAAHARRRGAREGGATFVDVGTGLVLRVGDREGAVSLARGASGWRLSARVEGAP